MAHIDNWAPIEHGRVDNVRNNLRRHFWSWFREHENDVLFRILFWKQRVRDLRWLFEELFGEEI